jgi:DNA-binding MarR family transcriptional regulator
MAGASSSNRPTSKLTPQEAHAIQLLYDHDEVKSYKCREDQQKIAALADRLGIDESKIKVY